MTILWLLHIDHTSGLRHGATLRYTHFSKGLLERGHRVYYGVIEEAGSGQSHAERDKYLQSLKKEMYFTDFVEFDYLAPSTLRRRLSQAMIHPRIRSHLLNYYHEGLYKSIYNVIRTLSVDLCIISERDFLFLTPKLSNICPTIIDWCDCWVLTHSREIRRLLKERHLMGLPSEVKRLLDAAIDEIFYGRHSSANVIVAQPDKKALDLLNGGSALNRVINNGVEMQSQNSAALTTKNRDQLIFTGTMSFRPNYQGALWFIENVMPLLLKSNKSLRLVIAGQEPVPALQAKASPNIEIRGFVPDLRAEIAKSQLYVAPLISGSGFRNKVVEAVASGAYVVGTPMALEFLPKRIRDLLLIGRTPAELAAHIKDYLENPKKFVPRQREALCLVRNEYQWPDRVKELEELCASIMQHHHLLTSSNA